MLYQEFAPPQDLADRVAALWSFAIGAECPGAFVHTIVPDGTVSIACGWIAPANLAFASVVGPRLDALRVPVSAGSSYWGVRFRPGAAPWPEIRSLLGQNVPLRDLCPAEAATLLGALGSRSADSEVLSLLARIARKLAAGAPPIDLAIAEAVAEVERLRGEAGVEALARLAGLSPRQFLRRFYASTGLRPKQYVRLRRLRWACAEAVLVTEHDGWGSVAADSGFADQAHLNREFRRIMGWTPAMVEEYLRRIEHRNVQS